MYEPTSGYADPVATTYAYATRAQDHGAEMLTQTAVTSLAVSGGKIVGVATSRGVIEASAVIMATGAWCNRLPDFAAAIYRGGYAAPYDMRPYGNPNLDRSKGTECLYWAVGFTRHAFKASPVVDRIVAELVMQGELRDHPTHLFGAARFKSGELLKAE